jgi:hypothetical protein
VDHTSAFLSLKKKSFSLYFLVAVFFFLKKWASELNGTFSKAEIQMLKKHIKKMLTISSNKGNTNQNHTKIPPYPC